MSSVESRAARRRHEHLLNRAAMDHEAAVATHRLRTSMDRERGDREAKETRGRVLDAQERTARDERYAHERAAAVQGLMAKHDAKSSKNDEDFAADIERIRRAGPTAGEHVARRAPERGDAHFEIWHSLDSARRQALIGVAEKYARLHNDADSEHFDLNRSGMQREDIKAAKTVRNRYGRPGTQIGSAIADRLEDKHFRLYEAEYGELRDMARRFERELTAERERLARQNAERRDLAAKHAAESHAHR